jgi:lipopolysaccharide transport system permease protein
MYKQTILGPLWLILNPLITVALYVFVFGNLAGLSTDGTPQMAFYLAGNTLWSYFSTALTETSGTFVNNAAVFGKVYFPRLVSPVAAVLTGLLNLLVQLAMLVVVMVLHTVRGYHFAVGLPLLWIPVLILQMAFLGLGCGIIISSLTTKYRDLKILVTFGIQLWMYVSPVVYSVAQIPEKYLHWYMLNPIAPIMNLWRYAILGSGTPHYGYWGISWVVTAVVLAVGVVLFSKVEKTFMDTV